MMRKYEVSVFKIAIHALAWLLLLWLVWDFYSGNLTVNPLQAATQRTGKYALVMLTASLACTPLNTVLNWRKPLQIRRLLGLYAFFFAVLHMLIFLGLDYRFDFQILWLDIAAKRYIWVGLLTLVLLTVLAATSFQWWMRRFGKNWKRLHRLVYLAGGLAVLHFAWSKKGDLLAFKGEIIQPLAFGLVVGLLLFARIPVVRKHIVKMRNRLTWMLTRNSQSPGSNTQPERSPQIRTVE